MQLTSISLAAEKHVHGQAMLTIAAEGSQLEIILESPAFNLVGFEHFANTDEQKQIVNNVHELLMAESDLFQFDGATCKADDIDIDLSAVNYDTEKTSYGNSHKKDSHETHHHKHEHKSSHTSYASDHDSNHVTNHSSHNKTAHSPKRNSHSDISATYRFTCNAANDLTGIIVGLLNQFTGIEELKAQWIVGHQQGAANLTQKSNTVDFKK